MLCIESNIAKKIMCFFEFIDACLTYFSRICLLLRITGDKMRAKLYMYGKLIRSQRWFKFQINLKITCNVNGSRALWIYVEKKQKLRCLWCRDSMCVCLCVIHVLMCSINLIEMAFPAWCRSDENVRYFNVSHYIECFMGKNWWRSQWVVLSCRYIFFSTFSSPCDG